MGDSVLAVLIDILHYHGSGNWQSFNRSFEKALTFFGIEIEKRNQQKLRRKAFYFLIDFGYLEVKFHKDSISWVIPECSIFELGTKELVAHGNNSFCRKVINTLSPSKPCFINNNKRNQISLDIDFYPLIPVFEGRKKSQIEEKLGVHNISLTQNFCDTLLDLLPQLESSIRRNVSAIKSIPHEDEGHISFFDADNLKWRDCESPYFFNCQSGLYKRRTKNPYLPFYKKEYFIIKELRGRKFFFRVDKPEWSYLASFLKLNQKIGITYDKTKCLIGFPDTVSLPRSLQRYLTGLSFEIPTFKNSFRVYSRIETYQVYKIVDKFPIFEVLELK